MFENSTERYDYIDELVLQFQAGDQQAAAELIEFFQPYFLKYISLIKDGKIRFSDRDTRRFVSLFMNDPETSRLLHKRRQSQSVKSNAYRTVNYLQKACYNIDTEDLKQEMYVAFLTMAKRWKKKNGKSNFSGYLYNAFRYYLFRSICLLIKDPVSNNTHLNLRYYDEDNLPEDEDVASKINLDRQITVVIEDEIDINWTRGYTCSEEFLQLTNLQRTILKYYYHDDLNDKEIANKTGLHINTIFKNRTKAVEILRDQVGQIYTG